MLSSQFDRLALNLEKNRAARGSRKNKNSSKATKELLNNNNNNKRQF